MNTLYYDNGNTLTLTGSNPNAQIIEFSSTGLGLIGVYDDVRAVVPNPSALACLLLEMFAMTLALRRRLDRRLPS